MMRGMQVVLNDIELQARILVEPGYRMTEDESYDFCQANADLRIERKTCCGR